MPFTNMERILKFYALKVSGSHHNNAPVVKYLTFCWYMLLLMEILFQKAGKQAVQGNNYSKTFHARIHSSLWIILFLVHPLLYRPITPSHIIPPLTRKKAKSLSKIY